MLFSRQSDGIQKGGIRDMGIPERGCYLLMPQHLLNYYDVIRAVKEPRGCRMPEHMEHKVGVLGQTHVPLALQPCSPEAAEVDVEGDPLVD